MSNIYKLLPVVRLIARIEAKDSEWTELGCPDKNIQIVDNITTMLDGITGEKASRKDLSNLLSLLFDSSDEAAKRAREKFSCSLAARVWRFYTLAGYPGGKETIEKDIGEIIRKKRDRNLRRENWQTPKNRLLPLPVSEYNRYAAIKRKSSEKGQGKFGIKRLLMIELNRAGKETTIYYQGLVAKKYKVVARSVSRHTYSTPGITGCIVCIEDIDAWDREGNTKQRYRNKRVAERGNV